MVDLDPRVDFDLMIEWWAGLDWGVDADAFLATQGDVWDTQWDMFLGIIGAISARSLRAKPPDQADSSVSKKRADYRVLGIFINHHHP